MSETGSQAPLLDEELNRRIVRSSMWVGLGVGGARLFAFASMLVLVRLLEPEAFGIVAVGTTLLAVVAQIQESGLGAALIHGRRHDPRVAASTVLVFASTAGVALTVLTILVAPLYTHLLHVPESTKYVQALAFVLVLRGLAVAPSSTLERELAFRSRTYAELIAAFVQASVSLACAIAGLGAWSLVAGVLAGAATLCVSFWAFAPWRPSPFGASRTMLRELLRYGRYVSGTNVMIIVNTNMDNAVVARSLGPAQLGVYNVAWRLADLVNTSIALVVGRVMFSVYSRLQHDVAMMRAAYVQNLQRETLFALPVTVTLGIAAEPIVLGLLGSDWQGAIAPLRLLAVFGFVRLLTAPAGELFKGIGKPHLALVTTIAFFVTALPALLYLVPRHGPTGAALAMVVGVSVSGSIALAMTCRLLRLAPSELARALARPAACAVLVGVAVFATLPADDALGNVGALLLVAAVASVSFLIGLVLFARPLVSPIVAGLRRA